jgi:hypothetical protein
VGSILAIDIIRLNGSLVHRGTWKEITEREVHCGTLKFISESKVGESTLPTNNPFKKLAPILRLRSAKETSPSLLVAGV